MSILALTKEQKSWILSNCDNSSQEDYLNVLAESGFGEQDIQQFNSEMGRLMLVNELGAEEIATDSVNLDLFRKCKRHEDARCQVGHVKSNLEKRLRLDSDSSTSRRSEHQKKLNDGYQAFMKNVNATVLMFDKSAFENIETFEPGPNGKIKLDSVKCRDLIDLFDFGGDDSQLCNTFFYSNEQVPNTDILGSGFFIGPDRVVTAAHVLEKAFFYNILPKNLMLVRGHFAYNTQALSIEVEENQLYVMDQETLIINDQVRYGDPNGDMAWIKVRPYRNNDIELNFNGFAPEPIAKGKKVYALGHGLGIPMKISFNGIITDDIYNGRATMFTCKMHILPGNSGSPIFDANTHQLVGVVGGLHEIIAVPNPQDDCADLSINMKGPFNGIATHIKPFTEF
ncbi:MAG: serine protease [Saprospiraceae bacterium]